MAAQLLQRQMLLMLLFRAESSTQYYPHMYSRCSAHFPQPTSRFPRSFDLLLRMLLLLQLRQQLLLFRGKKHSAVPHIHPASFWQCAQLVQLRLGHCGQVLHRLASNSYHVSRGIFEGQLYSSTVAATESSRCGARGLIAGRHEGFAETAAAAATTVAASGVRQTEIGGTPAAVRRPQ